LAHLAACQTGSGGRLHLYSLGSSAAVLPASFTTAVYARSEHNVASFYLCDGPIDDITRGRLEQGQIVHIELLWSPKPGKTPLDPSAANVSVRHIVIVDGEFGIYGGTGFATTSGGIGSSRVSVHIPDSTLTLIESSDRFADLLTPGRLSGSFTAVLDEPLARRVGMGASQIVTNLLGESRWVSAVSLDRRAHAAQ